MQPGVRQTDNNQWQFTVWAPLAESVEVVFALTDKSIALDRDRDGYWTLTLDKPPSGRTYWYRLNGELLRPDPASTYQPEGVQGPSQIVDHRKFIWTDADYRPVELSEYIIYELHIGTFTPEGTFAAAAEKLAYLKELGVTAVEVMPVAQFPGGRNWGYDGTFPYAVQNTYGGPDAFKQFVDTAHRLNLAVILDVVYNHLGPEGNYLRDFGPYFTECYQTPWGEAVNFDRAESNHVRNFFIENAIYWLRDYHIDALRLDALHAIMDMSAKHFIRELVERIQDLSCRLRRPFYVIGESDLNDVRLINPPEKGGYGLNAQWLDDFHHSLHALLTGEQFGYYQDFGSVSDLANALREGFVYDWKYSRFRKRMHGSRSSECPASKFVICAQNHDQVGNRMRGKRLSGLVNFEKLKLAAGCLVLAPCIPMLFMGEEYGEENPFRYFISMHDEKLIKAVQEGRASEFKSFRWQGECPDPQSEETFERSKLNRESCNNEHTALLLTFYKTLIQLRKSQVNYVSRENLSVGTIESLSILYWFRIWKSRHWLCLMNFSDKTRKFTCPQDISSAHLILDSADQVWAGPGTCAPTELNKNNKIAMPPNSVLLYESMIQNDENTHSDISYSI